MSNAAEKELIRILSEADGITTADADQLALIPPGQLLCVVKCAAKLAVCLRKGDKPPLQCIGEFANCVASCWR